MCRELAICSASIAINCTIFSSTLCLPCFSKAKDFRNTFVATAFRTRAVCGWSVENWSLGDGFQHLYDQCPKAYDQRSASVETGPVPSALDKQEQQGRICHSQCNIDKHQKSLCDKVAGYPAAGNTKSTLGTLSSYLALFDQCCCIFIPVKTKNCHSIVLLRYVDVLCHPSPIVFETPCKIF